LHLLPIGYQPISRLHVLGTGIGDS
jgi:hypothetical protein